MDQAELIAQAVYEGFEASRPDMVRQVTETVWHGLPDEGAVEDRIKRHTRSLVDEMAATAVDRVETRTHQAMETKAEAIRAALEAEMVRRVSQEVARVPAGKDGKDGRDGRDGDSVYWRGEYRDGKAYGQFDVVQRHGSAYIARRSTKDDPGDGSEDWGLLVARGEQGPRGHSVTGAAVRHGHLVVTTDDGQEHQAGAVMGPQGTEGKQGPEGQGFKFRARWDTDKHYRPQDVVTWNRASWVAATDLKGVEPGKDPRWRMLTPPGERGKRGAKGEEGRGIAAVEGALGKAVVTFTDGSQTEIEVRGVPMWRGAFDPGQEYVLGDVVRAGNAIWILEAEAAQGSAPSNENPDWAAMLRAPAVYGGGGGAGVPDFPTLALDLVDITASTAAEPYQMVKGFTRTSSAQAGNAVQLPANADGRWCVVSINTADVVEAYPPPGSQINFAGIDVAYELSGFATVRFMCIDPQFGHWITW